MAENQVNLYKPRSMAGAIEKRMPVTTFLQDLLFPGAPVTYPTEEIDMDFRKGAQIVAPFVAPRVGGINIARQGFTTRKYTPPRVAPERPISPDVLQDRLPGETIHTSMTPEERQDYYLERDAQELDDAITRREEVMVSQVATEGVITVRGYLDEAKKNYIDDEINYQMDVEHLITLSGTDSWEQAGSKKYDHIGDACTKIRKAGYNPQNAIFGEKSWKLFSDDTAVQAKLDNLRMELGRIAPELRLNNGNGYAYMGFLPEFGLNLWVYYAWYLNDDGVLTPYIPEDYLVIAPNGIGDMCYGAVTQLEEDKRYHTYEGTRIPKIIVDVNNDVMKYRLTSRPLPRPWDVDAWVRIDVVG